MSGKNVSGWIDSMLFSDKSLLEREWKVRHFKIDTQKFCFCFCWCSEKDLQSFQLTKPFEGVFWYQFDSIV